MEISITEGGSREYRNSTRNIWKHFAALTNYVSDPRIFICPTEKKFRIALQADATAMMLTQNENLSYFVGLEVVRREKPEMFLAGDRNITNGGFDSFRYGLARAGNLGTNHCNHPSRGAGWDQKNMHGHLGHVALADGSVQQYSSSALRMALQGTSDTNNRIAVPD